jgi:phosphoglycerol transferase
MHIAEYVVDSFGVKRHSNLFGEIEFSISEAPAFVQSIEGLSAAEPWGRWSDANLASKVIMSFTDDLPKDFSLILQLRPFGPNVGGTLGIRVGQYEGAVPLHAGDNEVRLAVSGGDGVRAVEFLPPLPISPLDLGMSSDIRKLGVGFIRLRIEY